MSARSVSADNPGHCTSSRTRSTAHDKTTMAPHIGKILSASHFGRKMSATAPSAGTQPLGHLRERASPARRSEHKPFDDHCRQCAPGPSGNAVEDAGNEDVQNADTQHREDRGVSQLDLEDRPAHEGVAALYSENSYASEAMVPRQ